MALLPYARFFKDASSMPLPRRTQQPRAWQVEPLEPRALLTTAYGPAGFEPPSISPAPHHAWAAEFASFAGSMPSSPPRPPGDMNLARSAIRAWSGGISFSSASEPLSIAAFPGPPPGIELPRMTEAWPLDQGPDGMGPPVSFFAVATRGTPGSGPPGRGFMTMSIFTRSRDEMNRGIPRLGLGPRPFFLPISSESYWEEGAGAGADPLFWLSENVSQSGLPSVTRDRARPGPSAGEGQGQTPAATNLTALASSSGTSASSVMIWVDAEAWAGEVSLASIVLSRGEFEPGALFPEEDLPELTALLESLLNEWLGETTELAFPLSGPFQQVTQLDPLDESSLALTATLLTVSNAPQAATKPGPGPDSESASVTTDAPLPAPPSWAGFVIGLDEAFEANRLAVHRWPAAKEPPTAAGPGDEAIAPPPTLESLEPTAVDKAIENLDREPAPSSPLDELFLRVLEDAEADENPPQDKSWRDAAGPASLSLAIIPALWAERLDLTPRFYSFSSVRQCRH